MEAPTENPVQEPIDPDVRLLILDLDETLTKTHTGLLDQSGLECRDAIEANLRNGPWVRARLASIAHENAAAGKIKTFVCIATFHHIKLHVEAYATALQGDLNVIHYIRCRDMQKERKSPPNKNGYTKDILEALDIQGISLKNVCLVDNDEDNWREAIQAGYSAILATPGKDDYMQHVEDFVARIAPVQRQSRSLYHSSDGSSDRNSLWYSGNSEASDSDERTPSPGSGRAALGCSQETTKEPSEQQPVERGKLTSSH